jgi:NADH:ubiquinone oxidoreductase subunit E
MRGSYHVIEAFKQFIEEYQLAEQVELQANFCVGECQHPVSVRINGGPCIPVNATEARDFLERQLGVNPCP